jgi:hypothetical protein
LWITRTEVAPRFAAGVRTGIAGPYMTKAFALRPDAMNALLEEKGDTKVNRERRKALKMVGDKLTNLKDELEKLYNKEQESLDGIPESLQGTERYEKAEESCDALSEALDHMNDACECVMTAVE